MRFWRVCFIALLLAPSAFAENFQKQADDFWMRAYTLQKAGKYGEAIALYDQSVAAERRSAQPRQAKMALTLKLTGFCYQQLAQIENALVPSQKALEIYRKLDDEEQIANALNSIGKLHAQIDQYEQAAAAYQESMQISRRTGQEPMLAAALANLASVLRKQGRYVEALTLYDESLAINTRLNRQGEIVTLLGNIGLIHQEQGNYQQAQQEFEDALAPEAAIVMYSEAPDEQLLQLLITDRGVKAAIRDLRQFAMNAPQDAQAAPPTETRGLRINGASDAEEPLASSSANFSKMIEQYRGLLTFDESDGRGLKLGNQQAAETPAAQDDALVALSKRLYALMFDQPMWDALRGKSRLIIVPDGLLNTLPFETLRDENGRYAVEQYDISYAPSVAVLEIVRQRRYPADRLPLLAFGGAVYQPETYRRDIAENAAQVAYLQRQADNALAANVPPSRVYDLLDLLWINLPGTLAEAQALGKVVKHAKIVTGEAVSERAVKNWSREGKLAEYRRIHFATHGIAIPKIGELSAIVLSLSPNATRDEDGYLNIPEILGMDIKADAVTLSACETALGQLFQGEGTVGLIQAFLIAGANGVSASLWQVADDSTAAFMVAYYRLLDDYHGDDARAISEIKRRFLRGEFGKEWTHPFFWAPFVHYGK